MTIFSKFIFKNIGEKGSSKNEGLCWPEFMPLFSAIGIILFFASLSLYAKEEQKEEPPWFAGNVIAFFGTNTEKEEFYALTFVYFTHLNGFYNSDSQLISNLNVHQYWVELELSYGLFKKIDVNIELFGYLIHNNGRNVSHAGDTNAFLGFQVLEEKKNSIIPNIRFLIGEIFPTGKYDGLDERFSGGDGVGFGAFSTYLSFIASKTCFVKHPFVWRLNLFYTISSNVYIEGRNIYIDNPRIKGIVKPGVEFAADFAFEYKFNKPWGIGIDVFFEQQNSSSFRNHSSDIIVSDIPSSHLLSLAPSLEYNFSDKMNMLVGAWFSVDGRNEFSSTTFLLSFYREF